MFGWFKTWWERSVCTSDQTLISQWETDVSKLPIIEQHYKDGTFRVLMPSEVTDLYDIQAGAYILPDDCIMPNIDPRVKEFMRPVKGLHDNPDTIEHELTLAHYDMDRTVSPNLMHSMDAQMINRLRDLPTEDHYPIKRTK